MIKKFADDLKAEFRGYGAGKLRNDLFAGITVAAVALPLALAFGVSSGGTASSGLITAIIAGIVIGSLAGGSYQISGPTGAMAAILAALIGQYGLRGVWAAGILSGVFLVLAGALRFGKLVSFIPPSVVSGFTSGIALIIAIGQIDNILGIKTPAAVSAAEKLLQYFETAITPNWYSLISTGIVIAVILKWPQKWRDKLPSSLAGLIAVTVVSLIFKFPVETIGRIPQTLFPDERFTFSLVSLAELKNMFIPAMSIATLGMVESMLCGEVAGRMKNEKYDANRDLISQGVGNIIIPFFGGIPATAAIARTSVGIKSGGQTRLVSVFHSIVLLLSMFLLAPVMSRIPISALSGVLIVTAWRMNEWKEIRYIFKCRFKGAILKYIITVLSTIIFDLTQAIVIGVVLALLLLVSSISNTIFTIQAFDADRFYKESGVRIENPSEKVYVAHFVGPMLFVNIGQIREQFEGIGDMAVLFLSMRGVSHMDISGLQVIRELCGRLEKTGCSLVVCGLQPQVKDMFERSSIIETIGESRVFASTKQAILSKLNKVS
jgi:SulP family sulfate permease